MPVFQSANFLCTTTGLKNSAWPGTACYIHLISLCAHAISGFPIWVRLVGDILGKMAKNCMKITKSTFFAQNRGGTWGQANCLGSAGGIPPSLLQLVETLRLILGLSQTFLTAKTWLRNIFFEKFPHDNIQQNFWENHPVVNFNCSSVCKVILCFEKFSQMLRQDP